MKDEIKSVLGIAYIFTIITAVFSLMTRMTIIFSAGSLQEGVRFFINRYSLWLIIAIGIIIVLNRINKIQNTSFIDALNNDIARKSSGVLIIIEGIFNLSVSYSTFTAFISSLTDSETNFFSDEEIMRYLVADLIGLTVLVFQVLFGIYLLRIYKSKTSGTNI